MPFLFMANSQKKFDVVALGSCTIDMIFHVDDIMRLDITDRDHVEKKYVAIENSSKLNVNSVKFHPGGSAANIACDLSNIGFKTAYIGGIGKDSNGQTCINDMNSHGVYTDGVKVYEDDATASSVILINPHYKDRSILAYKGANNRYSPKDVPEEMIKNARCFAWTSLTSDSSIAAIKKCIKITKENNILVAGAPSISIIKNRREETIQMMKDSDITSLNDEEILELTGKIDVISAMKELLNWGVKYVNCTMGKEGQWVTDGKRLVKTKPPKIVVMDTTGAGDATMSGVIYGVLENKSMEETAIIAASLSAMEIEATGVRVGLPEEMKGLEKFISEHEFPQESTNF